MRDIRHNFLWVLLCLFLSNCNQDKNPGQIPLEDFFKDQVKTSFLLSPDGSHVAYLQPYKDHLNIYVESADGKEVSRVTTETDQDVSSYFWANNKELLYLKDRIEDESVRLLAIDVNGKNSRELLAEKKVRLKFITPTKIWKNEVLLSMNKRDSSAMDAYRLNIATRQLTLAAQNPGNVTNWFTDQYGRLRLAVASDGINETLLFRDNEGESFKAAITNNFKTSITPIGFCPDRKSCIYALSNQGREMKALVEFDYKTGKEKKIFGRDDADIIEGGYSIKQKRLVYAVYETWKKERYYLDSAVKAIYKDLERQLPDQEVRIIDQDTVAGNCIVRTSTDKTPGSYYLYNSKLHQLRLLTEINPALKETDMADMKPVSFISRDSLLINGYLTLPKGPRKTNLPVVVIPHPNPTARTSWGYNSEVQFLANRGYAVFQVNFRGSNGYGKKFWIAGFKNWGTGMQNDITDGVRWLIKNGTANPKRIAIYGSSFGGYSALYGLCFQPELYACGASYSGLTNLFTYMKTTPPNIKPYLQMYYEMVGNPEKDAEYFRAVSPVFHTDKIKTPVLIAQGGKDPRVNVNETNQFVKELRKMNVPVTYILKDDERHYFRNQENRREVYRKLETFLSDHIGRK